jgi:hypothetical protein
VYEEEGGLISSKGGKTFRGLSGNLWRKNNCIRCLEAIISFFFWHLMSCRRQSKNRCQLVSQPPHTGLAYNYEGENKEEQAATAKLSAKGIDAGL